MRPLPLTAFAFAATCSLARAQTPPPPPAPEPPTVTAPRTAKHAEVAPLLPKLAELLKKGADGQALLAAAELAPLREVDEFRRAVAERAPKGEVTIAPAGEPGTPLVVRGRVTDTAGKPVPDALLYAYHTSAKGWYSDRAPHFAGGGQGGDIGHARLFAYVRTDAQGGFVLHTIRPGGYPRSTLPEHIHWHLSIGDKEIAGGEILFDDDARLTKQVRERAGRHDPIVKPEKEGDGIVVKPTLVVEVPAAPKK